MWVCINQRQPKPFARVWVETDTGRKTTAYVNCRGEWEINCPSIRVSGAKVVRWKDE